MNLDNHIGELEAAIDFASGSPAIRGAIPAGTDPAAWLASLEEDLRNVLGKHFNDYAVSVGDNLVRLVFEPRVIKTKEGRSAEFRENLDEIGKLFRAGQERHEATVAANPDNGKQGWWQVDGVRHDAIVQASSAPEAIQKAITAGKVGDWESADAWFIGEELPEVV